MNKLYVSALLTVAVFGPLSVFAVKMQPAKTKQENITSLFELVMPKGKMENVFDGVLANAQIDDAQFKAKVNDVFYVNAKKGMCSFYEVEFTEEEVAEIYSFFNSETGRHFIAASDAQNAAMMPAMQAAMGVVQEHLIARAKKDAQANGAHSVVINFDEQAHGKTDEEVRASFKTLIQHEGVTVVKCSAIWCGPCQVYAPTFDDVAAEVQELTSGNQKIAVRYVALDIDTAMAIAKDYGIKSVPTTMFFKNGQKVDAQVGGLQKAALRSRIERLA